MRLRVLALVALAAVALTGCMTRFVRQPMLDEPELRVYLRSEKALRGTVAKGYDHPIDIAPVRLGHILSRIDVRNNPCSRWAKRSRTHWRRRDRTRTWW
jgi:hypothetical protein